MLLNTYTSEGKFATSYDVEDATTGKVKTYTVPLGSASVTTGTNVMKGVYYIKPQGINLVNIQSYGGKGW